MPAETIDTADHVKHLPTGEFWLVAYVEGDRLCACGWPCTLADLSDCELIQKAAPGEKEALLRSMADMGFSDPRRFYAQRKIAEMEGGK